MKNILSFLRRNILPMGCEEILEHVVNLELVSEIEKFFHKGVYGFIFLSLILLWLFLSDCPIKTYCLSMLYINYYNASFRNRYFSVGYQPVYIC